MLLGVFWNFLCKIGFLTGLIGGKNSFSKPLSKEDEEKYLKQLHEGKTSSERRVAQETLVKHNMRLVAHIVKKYQSAEDDMEELISIGTIGLIKAVDTFDQEKARRLSTYAARCVENEILMYMRAKKKYMRETSYYEPIGTDKEGNQINLLDIAADEEVDVVEKMEECENIRKLYGYLPQVLTDREEHVIAMRYGVLGEEPHTQREVAATLGISRSYVSRIEKKALAMLRRQFEEDDR